MNINFAKYLIIVLLLAGCGKQETETKDYGFPKNENGSLNVSLELSEFKNYGLLIDRIREITCNDSIPKIVIKQKNIVRNVYPIEHCEPMIFDPDEKHYVTFRKGKPYRASTIIEIQSDSLGKKLTKDFSYYRNSNKSKKPDNYLVIIESERNEKVNGIEKFLTDLSQEYDKLKTEKELNISFWEVMPYTPPPPTMENEKPID
tara:strand:+ start:69 stop:677 length:609 start_codon:yes stop_codon:yes gene_type:complete